jgi:phosphohistidine swiveling domain-containing protein
LRALLLDRIWSAVGANEVAVRSSASAEDGEQQSFAGVFESHLNIERHTLEQAILDVAASFSSMRASSYGSNDNFAGDGHVLVQKMINADYAGVLFTRDPEAPGLMMVEVVEGTADALVSGMAMPEMFQYGRYSHNLAGESEPPIDLAPLIIMATRTETLFGAPQDIEWTWRDGKFMIVQSRDITTLGTGSKKERLRQQEWQRLLSRAKDADLDEELFRQDEMSEVLPRPTPLSLQMMQALWANGGSVDHACRRLGLSYDTGEDTPSRLTTIFGRLYTDTRLAARSAVEINRALTIRLNKSDTQIANDFRNNFLPAFNSEMSLLESANFDKLSANELLQLLQEHWQNFITDTHVEVEIINIVASYHIGKATQQLEDGDFDAASLLAITADVGPAKALSDASHLPADQQNDFLLQAMGHRAPFDYELAEPRYLEQPKRLMDLVASPGLAKSVGNQHEETLTKELEKTVRLARLYQHLKEEAKHQSLRHLAILRKLLVAVDRRYNLAGLCFYLTIEELLSLAKSDRNKLQKTARKRQKQVRQLLKASPLPVSLNLSDLESLSSKTLSATDAIDGQMAGTRVAGSREVYGRAHVVSSRDAELGNPLKGFEDGDIIVCSMVHPAWLPFVLRAGGVVCEVGGWLSHIAIVAREHDVAMIVGAQGLAAIPQNSHLHLDMDGRVEMLDEAAQQKSAAE